MRETTSEAFHNEPTQRLIMATQGNLFEEWKAISNYEGFYEVSSLGRVRSLPRNGTVKRINILTRQLNKRGYPRIQLSKTGLQKTLLVHRLVAQAFLGPCAEGYEVNHKDFDRANNTLSNLEYLTHQQNGAGLG